MKCEVLLKKIYSPHFVEILFFSQTNKAEAKQCKNYHSILQTSVNFFTKKIRCEHCDDLVSFGP